MEKWQSESISEGTTQPEWKRFAAGGVIRGQLCLLLFDLDIKDAISEENTLHS